MEFGRIGLWILINLIPLVVVILVCGYRKSRKKIDLNPKTVRNIPGPLAVPIFGTSWVSGI